ncbi:interferon lambda receptor 1-like [Labrus mixtus]|uniref:interferon lambda receptor 1-like n=1 Tax=Labrus mixtus TaxID=508554 RepID=UPI0029BFD055|nr:interferon lambda receptor 1-like [Labrus mixtus]
MAALIWMLTWLSQVLPAMTELPPPVNLNLTSDHLIDMLRWGRGAGTPPGVSYSVSVILDTDTSWIPVPGCQTVQDPLVCNLTEVFSDPSKLYFTSVRAQLDTLTSPTVYYSFGFQPNRDTFLAPPLLSIAPCGGKLCVHLKPPLQHLRHIYEQRTYRLRVSHRDDTLQFFKDSVSLGDLVLEDVSPGRKYCVSVCVLELTNSDYGRQVCVFTPSFFNADVWVSAFVCVCVLCAVFTVALLVYAGFICLKRRPLPSVLTSIHHIEEVLVLAAPCTSSFAPLYNVETTAPPAGDKRSHTSLSSEHSESEDESPGGGVYLTKRTKLLSSSSSLSSSVSAPSSHPFTSHSFTPPEAPQSAETAPPAGGQHTADQTPPVHTLSQPAGGGEEEGDGLNVNLLTLTFIHQEEEQEEEEEESFFNITSSLPSHDVTAETVSCPDEEEEEEEELGGYLRH